jgi:hypothetical protein
MRERAITVLHTSFDTNLPEMTPPLQSIWRNSNWFTAHPEKVAGRTEMRSTRFDGHQPFTIGTMDDVRRVLHFNDLPAMQPWHPAPGIKAVPPTGESTDKMATAIAKTKAAKAVERRIMPGEEPELLGFDTVMQRYSPKMTDTELRLYVQYMLGRGFDLETISDPANGWSRYTEPLDKDTLLRLCDEGKAGFDGKEWVPGGLFYSGAVYLKMEDLSRASQAIIREIGTERHEGQMKRMEDAAPPKLRIMAPDTERLFISPISTFADTHTVQDLMEETLSEPTSLRNVFWSWLVTLGPKDMKNGSSSYDVRYHFLEHKNFDKDTLPSEKANRQRKAHEDGMALFQRFLQEVLAPREQSVLEHVWNKDFNGWTEIPSYGVPTAFPINTRFNQGPIDPRPALWEGVRFIRAQKSGLIAFDVGVGKTMTAILCMADALYTGGAKRPLVVVPNPTYEKWITETVGSYDAQGNEISAGVLPHYRKRINDWYNLGSGYDQKPKQQPIQDGTITFVTYEGLLNMALSEKLIDSTLDMLVEKLDNGGTGREAALANEAIRTKYYDKLVTGGGINFDDMGFDMIVIDEAHRCKNLFESVKEEQQEEGKRDTKRYDMQGSASITALKAFAFTRHIQKQTGDRNVIYLTATPFTNSPLEIYSMLAQVGMDNLEKRGMGNAPAFFDNFVNETTEWAVQPTGGVKQKTVVKSFQNRVVLQSLIYGSIIFKTGEEANVPRPKKIVLPYQKDADGVPLDMDKQVLTFLAPSDLQKYWLAHLTTFAEDKKPQKTVIGREIPGEYYEDNGMLPAQALLAINMAQAVTLSPYLLNVSTGRGADSMDDSGKKVKGKRLGTRYLIEERPTATQYVETSPKLTYVMQCIRSVKKWHEDRKEAVSGQVIYMNAGADYFPLLQEYLIDKVGFKKSEVAIIAGGMNADKKEVIKAKFNGGEIKVLIGSASIREGIDLQKRSTVLYNCMLDWNPTDIVQLEGRIWRQNNIFSHVRIVVPLIENSIDPFLFQLLEEKTARINDIWARANRSNVLNVDKFDPAELKRGLMTNPKSIAQVEVDEKKAALEPELATATSYLEDLQNAEKSLERYDHALQWLRGTMKRSEAILRHQIEQEEKDMAMETAASKKEAIKKRIERYRTLIQDVKDSPMDNKAMYRLLKGANNLFITGNTWAANRWLQEKGFDPLYSSDASSEIRQIDAMIKDEKSLDSIQKGILSRAGMSLSDDLSPLIAEYAQEVGRLGEELAQLKSEEYMQQAIAKAQQELDERADRSQSLAVRVKQFESMNHLLGCYMNVNDCSVEDKTIRKLPQAEIEEAVVIPDEPTKLTKDQMLMLAKARMRRVRVLALMEEELESAAA